MKSREIISIIILALGLTAAILPNRKNDSIQLTEKQLLQEMLCQRIAPDVIRHNAAIGF